MSSTTITLNKTSSGLNSNLENLSPKDQSYTSKINFKPNQTFQMSKLEIANSSNKVITMTGTTLDKKVIPLSTKNENKPKIFPNFQVNMSLKSSSPKPLNKTPVVKAEKNK